MLGEAGMGSLQLLSFWQLLRAAVPQVGPTCVAVEFLCAQCYRLTHRPESVRTLEDGIIWGEEILAGYKTVQAG